MNWEVWFWLLIAYLLLAICLQVRSLRFQQKDLSLASSLLFSGWQTDVYKQPRRSGRSYTYELKSTKKSTMYLWGCDTARGLPWCVFLWLDISPPCWVYLGRKEIRHASGKGPKVTLDLGMNVEEVFDVRGDADAPSVFVGGAFQRLVTVAMRDKYLRSIECRPRDSEPFQNTSHSGGIVVYRDRGLACLKKDAEILQEYVRALEAVAVEWQGQ
jgi:hypothetical protein